jgi:hypothetical protein
MKLSRLVVWAAGSVVEQTIAKKYHCIQCGFFLSIIPGKFLHAFLVYPMRSTCTSISSLMHVVLYSVGGHGNEE